MMSWQAGARCLWQVPSPQLTCGTTLLPTLIWRDTVKEVKQMHGKFHCAQVYVVQIKSLVVNEPVSLTALTPVLLLQGNPPVSILNRP